MRKVQNTHYLVKIINNMYGLDIKSVNMMYFVVQNYVL